MKPRIAVVLDAWSHPFNGTVVSTRRFVAALADAFDFTILAVGDGAGVAGPAASGVDDVPVAGFPKLSVPPFNGLIDSMRVPLARPQKARLRDALHGCALLHLQFPFLLGYSAISVAHELGIPVVSSFHVQPENILRNIGLTSPVMARWLYQLFLRAIYERSDMVVAPSEFAANLLLAHGLQAPVTVLSNGIPRAFFAVERDPDARPCGRVQLLSVGRLAREKQHRVLLHAVALSRHRDLIDLRIIGTGPLETELRALAAALRVSADIGVATDDELMARHAKADLFIHTGEIELEGMSVTEAMAAGNAILVSDSMNSAARNLIPDPEAVFRTGDARDLALRIDRFLDLGERRELAARENRRRALAFAHDRSASELARLYRSLIGTGTEDP